MKYKTKILLAIPFILIGIIAFAGLLQYHGQAGKPEYFQVFKDQALTQKIEASEFLAHVSDATPGTWTNRSFWLLNVYAKPFQLGFEAYIPEGYSLLWDYDGHVIEPRQKLEIMLSFYAPQNGSYGYFQSRFRLYCIIPLNDTATVVQA